MECAVCKAKVNDFKLQKLPATPSVSISPKPMPQMNDFNSAYNQSFVGALDEGFQDFFDRAQGASTPVGNRPQKSSNTIRPDERVVLRIDNVPWVRLFIQLVVCALTSWQDITPPAIASWLKQPVERVHVLLDRKGKTLSHAFAEMANPEAAKTALRCSQNSVLGKGKRARGVTVTRSNQEELMRAVSGIYRL